MFIPWWGIILIVIFIILPIGNVQDSESDLEEFRGEYEDKLSDLEPYNTDDYDNEDK